MRRLLLIVVSILLVVLLLGIDVCNAFPFSNSDPFAHVDWRLPTEAELVENLGYVPDMPIDVLDRFETLIVSCIVLNILFWYLLLLGYVFHYLVDFMLRLFRLKRVQPKKIKRWHFTTVARKCAFVNLCVSYFLVAIYNSFEFRTLTLDVYGLDRTIPFVIDINLWVIVLFLCIFAIVLLCKYVLGRPKFSIWLLLLLIILSCVINMRDVLIPLLTLWSR